jgi:YHS domain-containing protein
VRGGTQEEIALLALAEIVSARRKRPMKVTAEVAAEVAQVTFVTDPVCGMTVDPLTATRKSTHIGIDYWFCSDGCKAEFEKEPGRYLRPVEA